MEKDTALLFIRALQFEFIMFLVFFIGIRKKMTRPWQLRISVGLLSTIAATFIAFFYFLYANGLIKN
jgi:hypothetical protein